MSEQIKGFMADLLAACCLAAGVVVPVGLYFGGLL